MSRTVTNILDRSSDSESPAPAKPAIRRSLTTPMDSDSSDSDSRPLKDPRPVKRVRRSSDDDDDDDDNAYTMSSNPRTHRNQWTTVAIRAKTEAEFEALLEQHPKSSKETYAAVRTMNRVVRKANEKGVLPAVYLAELCDAIGIKHIPISKVQRGMNKDDIQAYVKAVDEYLDNPGNRVQSARNLSSPADFPIGDYELVRFALTCDHLNDPSGSTPAGVANVFLCGKRMQYAKDMWMYGSDAAKPHSAWMFVVAFITHHHAVLAERDVPVVLVHDMAGKAAAYGCAQNLRALFQGLRITTWCTVNDKGTQRTIGSAETELGLIRSRVRPTTGTLAGRRLGIEMDLQDLVASMGGTGWEGTPRVGSPKEPATPVVGEHVPPMSECVAAVGLRTPRSGLGEFGDSLVQASVAVPRIPPATISSEHAR
jgi:hypothetical protein